MVDILVRIECGVVIAIVIAIFIVDGKWVTGEAENNSKEYYY